MTSITPKAASTKPCIRDFEERVCISEDCMAWRWSEGKRTNSFLDAVRDKMTETGADFRKASQVVYAQNNFDYTEGYCGLAGKPEV